MLFIFTNNLIYCGRVCVIASNTVQSRLLQIAETLVKLIDFSAISENETINDML